MSFLGLHLLSDAAYAHIKAAGHDVTTFAATEADKAVIVLKSTSIGAAVAADIAAVKDHALTGPQKFEAVLANTLPLLLTYLTGGGIAAVEKDVTDIARGLVQSTYNDFSSTTAGGVAASILKLFAKA